MYDNNGSIRDSIDNAISGLGYEVSFLDKSGCNTLRFNLKRVETLEEYSRGVSLAVDTGDACTYVTCKYDVIIKLNDPGWRDHIRQYLERNITYYAKLNEYMSQVKDMEIEMGTILPDSVSCSIDHKLSGTHIVTFSFDESWRIKTYKVCITCSQPKHRIDYDAIIKKPRYTAKILWDSVSRKLKYK